MSQKYEFPDDPVVFARVLEHFRSMKATDWDALLDRYVREARAGTPVQEETPVLIANGNQRTKAKSSPVKPTKRS